MTEEELKKGWIRTVTHASTVLALSAKAAEEVDDLPGIIKATAQFSAMFASTCESTLEILKITGCDPNGIDNDISQD